MAHVSCLLLFILSYLSLLSLAQEEWTFSPNCGSFSCGNLGSISFPFSNRTHPECGFCMLDDCDEPIQKIQLGKDGPWYNITRISQDDVVTISDQVFQNRLNNRSCESFRNFTIPNTPLFSFEILSNLTLFKCPRTVDSRISTNFNLSCDDSIIFYNHPNQNLPSLPPQCSLIQLPVNIPTPNTSDLFNLLSGVFSVNLRGVGRRRRECQTCRGGGGRCLLDSKGHLLCSIKITAGHGKLRLRLGLGLDWIYKHLETDEDLVFQGIENEEDKEYARKMIISPPQYSLIHLAVNNNRNTSDLFNLLTGLFYFKLHPDWHAGRECLNCRSGGGRCLIDSKGYLQCSNRRRGIKIYKKFYTSFRTQYLLSVCL
ncbi:LEAF RUST 10 DISEASE-RESISTANCE LOCUS RECEPTOR-LIKE PROTEIN KINASE-like 1.1 [Melia azedarach]|uniref:LEAF RUST 10 DISEASE-RESISTANCE LOCUS RECEPTOR-LIKE PROTEIN KINASE-like 1.1 n=1 Tax=Melia azedarach TaxID=155640 RepID=A0ACC1XES5_MELAZ|nr:LEAF RUST 10 DISEASE-RESISTANCE LOCUS RECEPTOR-LIKE PROTEIN KINASE-like 1.1 [Melia azedarach]